MQNAPLISSLLPYEVTRELLDLASQAGAFERRLMLHSITGHLSQVVTVTELREAIGSLPEDERAMQLCWARRWVGLGMKQYGALDLDTDRRDRLAEANEESPDGYFYIVADLAKNGRTDDKLLRLWTEIMRYGTAELLKHGAI